jgi:D-alanyl-D-alanine carboxypeptidase
LRYVRRLIGVAALALAVIAGPGIGTAKPPADATPYVVVDVATGAVIAHRQADQAWYPASLAKLMTAYVTFRAMAAGKVRPTTKIVQSAAAAGQDPVSIGFAVGARIGLGNALKMMIVPSANDIAVAIAETVGRNVPAFVKMMNAEATRLGMVKTNFENPHGQPAAAQVSTARDLAILARQIWIEFPQHRSLFAIQAISTAGSVFHSPNLLLLERYPGAQGMKTGFSCEAGYNLVAAATRNGRTLLAVVLGRTSSIDRAELTASLLDQGFATTALPDEGIKLAAFSDPASDAGPVEMRLCNGSGVDRVGFTSSTLGRAVAVAKPAKVEADWVPPKPKPPPRPAGATAVAGVHVYVPPPVLSEMPEKRRYRINDETPASDDE